MDSVTSIFENPWWGMSDNDTPPPKPELFNGSYGAQLKIEDFLQRNGVFVNGFGEGKHHRHSDSYGTVVDFEALEKALQILENQYQTTAAEWTLMAEKWTKGANMQPPLRIVGAMIHHRYNSPNTALATPSPLS